MLLKLNKSGAVFLHIQKTGGTWVRDALLNAGVPTTVHTDKEQYDWQASRALGGRWRFTAVRRPFGWYASFWAHRNRLGWGGNLAVGHVVNRPTFEEWVMWVTEQYPGFLHELYGRYVGPGTLLMQTETLADDLTFVLHALQEPFDEDRLRSTPPANVIASTDPPVYTAAMRDAVLRSERETMERYGYA